MGKLCAYILGFAAQHIKTASSFVIVPASPNTGKDKHPAGQNKLLIGWWISTCIAPTCKLQVQEQEHANRKLIAMVAIGILVGTTPQRVTGMRGRQDIYFLCHSIVPTL
jgi:hypothetical protein